MVKVITLKNSLLSVSVVWMSHELRTIIIIIKFKVTCRSPPGSLVRKFRHKKVSHGWLRSAMWRMRKRTDNSMAYTAVGVRWRWRCGGSWVPERQSSESGLNAAPLLSVSLARTPDRGLVTINIASRRFLAPLSFTFSTAIAAVWPDNCARCLRKYYIGSTCKLGYSCRYRFVVNLGTNISFTFLCNLYLMPIFIFVVYPRTRMCQCLHLSTILIKYDFM